MTTCGAPTIWPPIGTACATTAGAATATCIDGVNLNGSIEKIDGIQATLNAPAALGGPGIQSAAVCFTPLGRAYYYQGSGAPTFISGSPMIGEIQIQVQHSYPSDPSGAFTGITRTVIVPNSGSTRIVSH
jgi:hypothetical protein